MPSSGKTSVSAWYGSEKLNKNNTFNFVRKRKNLVTEKMKCDFTFVTANEKGKRGFILKEAVFNQRLKRRKCILFIWPLCLRFFSFLFLQRLSTRVFFLRFQKVQTSFFPVEKESMIGARKTSVGVHGGKTGLGNWTLKFHWNNHGDLLLIFQHSVNCTESIFFYDLFGRRLTGQMFSSWWWQLERLSKNCGCQNCSDPEACHHVLVEVLRGQDRV